MVKTRRQAALRVVDYTDNTGTIKKRPGLKNKAELTAMEDNIGTSVILSGTNASHVFASDVTIPQIGAAKVCVSKSSLVDMDEDSANSVKVVKTIEKDRKSLLTNLPTTEEISATMIESELDEANSRKRKNIEISAQEILRLYFVPY